MIATYGFNATLTARSGMGDRLIDLLLTGLDEEAPARVSTASSISSRVPRPIPTSSTSPRAGPARRTTTGSSPSEAAQAIVARIDGLLAKDSTYTDYVPVRGKAAF